MAGATDIAEPKVWDEQRREFERTFPSLARVGIARQWSGTIGMTLDRFPIIGQLSESPGLFFVGGWSGHGVGMATASGAIVADLLSGARRGSPRSHGTATGQPGSPATRSGRSAFPLYLTGLSGGSSRGACSTGGSRVEAQLPSVCHSPTLAESQ